MAADDFDDVTGFKTPGRSHEVELIVVARPDLEAVEQQAQGDIRDELAKLHAQQREARTRVQEAIQQARNTGTLRPEDLDKLGQAELAQQQIRNRISNPEDGLRARLEKLRQAAKDNHLPRSATTERLDEAARELGRLANEELEPLEAELANARKAAGPKESPAGPLAQAEKHQKEVEQTLMSLLERLEPWSGAAGIRGEARSVLNDLNRQTEKAEKLGDKVPPDTSPEALTPEQKAELDKAAVGDDRVAERGRALVEKMNRLAIEKDAAVRAKLELADRKDAEAQAKRAEAANARPGSEEQKALNRQADDLAGEAKQTRESAEDMKREADALRNAATAGNAEQLKEQLRAAGRLTRQNQPSRAAAEQKAAAGNLEKMLNALEEQKADDADRLTKRLKDADKQLDELIEKQELLQKKAETAETIQDPEQRRAELEKLGREQEKLEREARDLAQRLTRNQGERAADELKRAAREMTQAASRWRTGTRPARRSPTHSSGSTRPKPNSTRPATRTRRSCSASRRPNSPTRSKALATGCNGSATRPGGSTGSSRRPASGSGRSARASTTCGSSSRDWPAKCAALLEKKFQNAAVFGRMLRQSADAMDLAAKRMDNRLEAAEVGPFDPELEDIADAGIQSQQKLAPQAARPVARRPQTRQAGRGPPAADGRDAAGHAPDGDADGRPVAAARPAQGVAGPTGGHRRADRGV